MRKSTKCDEEDFQANTGEIIQSLSGSLSKHSRWDVTPWPGAFREVDWGEIYQVHERPQAQNFIRHSLFLTPKQKALVQYLLRTAIPGCSGFCGFSNGRDSASFPTELIF